MLGTAELDTLLAERDELNDSLRRIIDEQTEPWGIKVTTVEIKDVEIPEAMQRAMARAAEVAMQLRYQQTLVELGGEKHTVVFPLPLDLISPFLRETRDGQDSG